MMIEVREYTTPNRKRPFSEWLKELRDQKFRNRILARVARVRFGNFGDCRPVGDGVFELRMMFGPGFRIYLGRERSRVVLLLCGGDKKTQAKDIEKAKAFWAEYQEKQDG